MSDVQEYAVDGLVNYTVDNGGVNRFHAKNSALDTFATDPRVMAMTDGRRLADAPRLDREGFALFVMPSTVSDFRDQAQVAAVHLREVEGFIAGITGADAVVVTGPATLRFGERSDAADRAGHSKAARLVHSDTGRQAAMDFTAQSNPHPDRAVKRTAHHNIWRTFSSPPQDLPLAVCDFRSVLPADALRAEAAFDDDEGNVGWTFEAMLFAWNPDHRWIYFPDMTRDEVLVFKRFDTADGQPWFVPHTAFEDRSRPAAVPRASIEIRTIAYWYA